MENCNIERKMTTIQYRKKSQSGKRTLVYLSWQWNFCRQLVLDLCIDMFTILVKEEPIKIQQTFRKIRFVSDSLHKTFRKRRFVSDSLHKTFHKRRFVSDSLHKTFRKRRFVSDSLHKMLNKKVLQQPQKKSKYSVTALWRTIISQRVLSNLYVAISEIL